jgi:hypothetical protein
MVSLTMTVVSVTHTIFSEAEKMVSVPQTMVCAIERTGSTPAREILQTTLLSWTSRSSE